MTERAEPMISYAQNFEDVILWRALRDVPNGFYIDIGAGHPVADSVTMHFYEHGWRGINVEPDPGSSPSSLAAGRAMPTSNVQRGIRIEAET